MTTTLQDSRLVSTLDRMYTESKNQMSLLRERSGTFDRPMTTQERTEAMSEFYIPVTPEAGRLLYALVRATRPANVVEFGMSFGISALHLAAAVRDNGTGRVATTELSETKIAAAKTTFAETGLDDVITILEGDALTTLESLDGGIDFLLLDGWKSVPSRDRTFGAPPVHGCVGDRRQRQFGRYGALSRSRAQPGQRLRQLQLPGSRQRQHGDQLPHKRLGPTAAIPRATA